MKRYGVVTSFSVSTNDVWILEEVQKIAEREHVSFSAVVVEAVKSYIKIHQKGNPQTMLIPHQSKVWECLPVEKRLENLQWLRSFVDRNAGKMNQLQLVSQFSSISGLKMETVTEYVKTLLLAKKLVVKSGKVYATDEGGDA